MSLLGFLVAWGNAPFAVALGTVGLFGLLQATGLLGLIAGGDHDGADGADGADVDGHDIDGADADVDGDGHDGTSDADHDADGDHEQGHGHAGGRSAAGLLLAPLGIGKMPFSLVWQIYGVVFALVGLGLNARYVTESHGPPASTLFWTIPIALSAGYGAVAALARLLSPIFATKEHEATRRSELVGHVGIVISTKVDEAFGEVRFRDKTGHDLRIVCKLAPGHEPARERERVLVVDHDAITGALLVARLDEGLAFERREPMKQTKKATAEQVERAIEGEEGKGVRNAAN